MTEKDQAMIILERLRGIEEEKKKLRLLQSDLQQRENNLGAQLNTILDEVFDSGNV